MDDFTKQAIDTLATELSAALHENLNKTVRSSLIASADELLLETKERSRQVEVITKELAKQNKTYPELIEKIDILLGVFTEIHSQTNSLEQSVSNGMTGIAEANAQLLSNGNDALGQIGKLDEKLEKLSKRAIDEAEVNSSFRVVHKRLIIWGMVIVSTSLCASVLSLLLQWSGAK